MLQGESKIIMNMNTRDLYVVIRAIALKTKMWAAQDSGGCVWSRRTKYSCVI